MYKQDLALNNLQWLICHEIQPKAGTKTVKVFLSSLVRQSHAGLIFQNGSEKKSFL